MDKFFLTPYNYVFESDTFPLTIKAMFPGFAIDRHRHDQFFELVLVVSGQAVHLWEECQYTISAGDVFIIPPDSYHGYADCDNFNYYNLLVDFRNLKLPLYDLIYTQGYKKLFTDLPRSCGVSVQAPEHFRLTLDKLDKASQILGDIFKIQSLRKVGYQMAMVAEFTALLSLLCDPGEEDALAEGANLPEGIAMNINVLSLALGRFCENRWTIQQMCRHSGLSRAVLFREFQKYHHVSPVHFLNIQRLRKASYLLLNSELTIDTVATQCGFANGNYFATVFRKEFGMTPLQFRRTRKQAPHQDNAEQPNYPSVPHLP